MPYRTSLPRHSVAAICLTIIGGLFGLPSDSDAKETLTWLLRDLPPSIILSGPDQGQGAIDLLIPLLTARMPEYDHVMMNVNRARSTQMLKEGSFVCDPTVLWTPERSSYIAFSIPAYAAFSNGLVVRREDRQLFDAYRSDNTIDLAALLKSKTIKLGVVAERSYGQIIDPILQNVPEGELSEHYGNDAIGSLLQMERLGRLQALISYWPEALYQAKRQDISADDLEFLRIKGTPKYQFTHIGCADTPQGRHAIEVINREVRALRDNVLVEFYARWLPPNSREEYMQDAQAFYDQ